MKKYFFTVLVIFTSVLVITGQTITNGVDKAQQLQVTVDQRLDEGFQYYFEDFTKGKVVFKDDSIGTAYLNYNILLGEIHFISQELCSKTNSRRGKSHRD